MLHTDINTYIYFVHFSVHLSLFVFATSKIIHFCYRAQFTWSGQDSQVLRRATGKRQ